MECILIYVRPYANWKAGGGWVGVGGEGVEAASPVYKRGDKRARDVFDVLLE